MSVEDRQLISRWERVKSLGKDVNLEIILEKGFAVIDGCGVELKLFSEITPLEVFVSGYAFGFKAK